MPLGASRISWIAKALETGGISWGSDYPEITDVFTADGSTIFLTSFDGSDGQQSATDETGNYTISFAGNAAITTDEKKFGTASLDSFVFTNQGTDDCYISTSDTDLIQWHKDNITIEAWIYFTDITTAETGGTVPRLMGNFVKVGGANYWSFGPTDDGALRFYFYDGSGRYVTSSTGLITENTWHHIAMTSDREERKIRLWHNGSLVATSSDTWDLYGTPGYQADFRFLNYSGIPSCYIDEVRISRGCRYNDTTTDRQGSHAISLDTGDYYNGNLFTGNPSNTGAAEAAGAFTMSFWFRADTSSGGWTSGQGFLFEELYASIGGKYGFPIRWQIEYNATNKIQFESFNSSNARIGRTGYNQGTGASGGAISADTWYWCAVSYDSSGGGFQVYIGERGNGTPVAQTFYTNVTSSQEIYTNWHYNAVNQSKDYGGLGARYAGNIQFAGEIAEVWMAETKIDLSSATNRQKFYSSSGYPVDLGSDGSNPTGSQPTIYFSGDASDFQIQRGSHPRTFDIPTYSSGNKPISITGPKQ